ncbi:MAG: hypothetical protein N2572_05710 [Syntrophales bacterium]|nr:hypothetical protein [Syntrophales bacterium]
MCSQQAAFAQIQPKEHEIIVATAEKLFFAMKEKNYTDIWRLITKKSKEEICSNVIKAAKKHGETLQTSQVAQDFAEGGPIAQAYWNAYLDVFNPDMVLKESAWQMGEVKKKEAIIILQHKKAERPARLQMKKEDDQWKVGLEETFGILRWVVK